MSPLSPLLCFPFLFVFFSLFSFFEKGERKQTKGQTSFRKCKVSKLYLPRGNLQKIPLKISACHTPKKEKKKKRKKKKKKKREREQSGKGGEKKNENECECVLSRVRNLYVVW